MKTYVLFIVFYVISYAGSHAKIINGYECDVENAKTSLRHLEALPQEKSVIRRLQTVRQFMLYHELTESLLAEFRRISPGIYQQIDTITDLMKRPVDVYVKFVPKHGVEPGTIATTNVNQHRSDNHAYISEYGPNTVSVKITLVKHSLTILAHEFGHVSHQVPNLAEYVRFFSRHYSDRTLAHTYLGHRPDDPAGRTATAFERIYRRDNARFADGSFGLQSDPLKLHDQLAKKYE